MSEAARRQAARDAVAQRLAAGKQGVADQRQALASRVTDIRAQNDAARQTAVNTLMQQMKQRGEQAKLALQNAPTPPSVTPNAAPLKQITGVSLTPELSGSNAAQSAFYVSPESTQAQFAVGASVGGGNIGQRQKKTTKDVVSQPDNFNSSRKGDF
jgi:hypothetical protein